MSIFKYGWAPSVKQTSDANLILPTIPVRYLQNVDSLHDFMFRVNLLGSFLSRHQFFLFLNFCFGFFLAGWTSRKDFEEIWMGLLGVLSATPIGQELQSNSAQEITNRVCASTVAVRCISSLLLQSLLYPTPGRPILSKFISKHREKQSTFLKTKYLSVFCFKFSFSVQKCFHFVFFLSVRANVYVNLNEKFLDLSSSIYRIFNDVRRRRTDEILNAFITISITPSVSFQSTRYGR